MDLTLDELAEFLARIGIPCEVDGDGSVRVSAVATLEDAGEGQISFLSNPKYENAPGDHAGLGRAGPPGRASRPGR